MDIDFFKTLVLEGVLIDDQQGDTLLSLDELSLAIGPINFDKQQYTVNAVRLQKPVIHIKTVSGDSVLNIDFLIDYFSSPTKKQETASKPIQLQVKSVSIVDADFLYDVDSTTRQAPHYINFDDLHVHHFNTEINQISIADSGIRANIKSLNFQEKSGFIVEELRANVKCTDKEIELANLYLLTPHSSIHDYYSMRFDSLADMDNYIEKVRMFADFEESIVSFKDIRYFATELHDYHQTVMIDGKISGTVAALKSNNIKIRTGNNTFIKGAIRMDGLPNIDDTQFVGEFSDLRTNYSDLTDFLRGIDQEESAASIPIELKNLGLVKYRGTYVGTAFNFKAKGNFQTAIGTLDNDFHLDIRNIDEPNYDGTVKLNSIELGTFLQTSAVGDLSGDLVFKGKGFDLDKLNVEFQTQIASIEVNQYTYHNIDAKGNVKDKFFDGNATINDPNAKLNFDGKVDYKNPALPAFDFVADVQDLKLHKINLSEDTLSLTTEIDAKFKGNNFDNLVGSIVLKDLTFNAGKYKKHVLQNVSLVSRISEDEKTMQFSSDVIDAGISGTYKLSTIVSALKGMMKQYTPSLNLGPQYAYSEQDFSFYVFFENADPLTEIFFPEIKFSRSGALRGTFNTRDTLLRINGGFDYVKYENYTLKKVIIDGENNNERFDLNIASAVGYLNDSTNFDNIAVATSFYDDNMDFNIKLGEKTSINQLDLNGYIAIRNKGTSIHILPSELVLNNQDWLLSDSTVITFAGPSKIAIDNFEIIHEEQRVYVEGILSSAHSDQITVLIQNFDVANINQLLKKYDVLLEGRLNANAQIEAGLGDAIMVSNLQIDQLIYNLDTVGNVSFKNSWDPKSKRILVDGNIYNRRLKTFEVGGFIATRADEENLNLDVRMNETELTVIEPFVRNYVSKISGTAIADLQVRGSFSKPKIQGDLSLINAGLTVNYLQARLYLSEKIKLSQNKIQFDNVKVRDEEGNSGVITGSVSHDFFDDFVLGIKMKTKKLLCLKTTAKDNELYYGKAYATGDFSFTGPLDDIKIDIRAKTEAGTKFFIPLSEESSITKVNYVRYMRKDSLQNLDQYKVKLTGITMNMYLIVDDQSEVQLIMDPKTGEAIKGRGNTSLRLLLDNDGSFSMFGVYEISEGDYNFTLQNIINKKFKVAKGGTIRWNGDPLKGRIDLSAIYEIRPAIYPLIVSANPADTNSYSTTQRVKTQCILYLKNDLMSPDIKFDILFPDDEEVNSKAGGYLANPDNMNTQFASLLVFSRFTNSSGNTNFVPTTGFLEAQLSNLVSMKNFDISLQNGVGGSLRLFNDRVVIDGMFSTTDAAPASGQTQNASSITGDVNIEYKISKDGRFRAKAFSRNDVNSDLLKRGNSQVEQGMGVFYRVEFDTFGEFFRKVFLPKKQEKSLPKAELPADTTNSSK